MIEPLAHLSVGHSTAGQFHLQLPLPTHSPTMAEQQQEFGYHNIVLYKSQTLGTGSYGGVCKAKCDGLPCAAKIMHPTLFDLRDPGTTSYLRRFEEECRLLSLARHPNIVQYLATYRDPETHLPVLLMELCDESLCRFFERSVGPLPYHTELNISHDIALALVYLHTNGLIHRDLTGNNVLMIAGVRAKVTDFGMSKLAGINPRMTPLTLCPGNLQYMSPEALEEPPSYTEKLDIFSLGVLLVQIMTRQFPNPGPRFQVLDIPDDPRFPEGTVRVPIPETQRRSAHLQLISSTHPLKAIAVNCLKGKERERPSAQQLSSTLSELKGGPHYAESVQQAQSGEGNGQEVGILRRQVRDLQQRDQEQRQEIEWLRQEKQEQQRENEQLHLRQQQFVAQVHQLEQQLHVQQESVAQVQQQLQGQQFLAAAMERENQQLRSTVEEKERDIRTKERKRKASEQLERELQANNKQVQQQLQGQWVLTEAGKRENQQLRSTVEEMERELHQKNHTIQTREGELQASKQLVAQFQLSMEQKDRTIRDLQQIISAHERNIQQLEQQVRASSGQPRQLPVTAEIAQATATAAEKDITTLRWEEGKETPERMYRGAAVVDGNTVYINSGSSHKVYSCQMTSEGLLWSTLPDSRYELFSLAVIDGLLTCVGGRSDGMGGLRANILHSLTGGGHNRQWSEVFPPMPTARSETTSVTTEQALVVAGGWDGKTILDTVEVMTIATKQWTTAQHLLHPYTLISGTICGDQLYLSGGFIGFVEESKSVLTCSLTDLLPPQSLGVKLRTLSPATKPGVWREIKKLPVTRSTFTTLGGHLLAIGGRSDSHGPTADVHRYDHQTDSWHVIAKMRNKRYQPLSAVLPENQLLVVGGMNVESSTSVEIGSLPVSG